MPNVWSGLNEGASVGEKANVTLDKSQPSGRQMEGTFQINAVSSLRRTESFLK